MLIMHPDKFHGITVVRGTRTDRDLLKPLNVKIIRGVD